MKNSLLSARALQNFLREHHLPPLDRLGQHFLVNRKVLQDIIKAANPDPHIPIIEIGAGLGALTRELAHVRQRMTEKTKRKREHNKGPIIAVEIDKRFIPILQKRIQEFHAVQIIHANILKLSPSFLLPASYILHPRSYDIIGNIPYNITARLLRHLLEWSPPPRRITFLMDSEVAKRVAASPPKMSLLAVSVQVYTKPKIVKSSIPPSAFFPQPKIESAIIRLDMRKVPLVSKAETKSFFKLVAAGFSQRRKTLQNALRASWQCSSRKAEEVLRASNIEPTRRAQTLTIKEWKKLFQIRKMIKM